MEVITSGRPEHEAYYVAGRRRKTTMAGDLDMPAHRLLQKPAKPASNTLKLVGCLDCEAVL